MLGSKRDQTPHLGRPVPTTLDVRPQELSALGETEGVDGRGGAEDVVGCEVGADGGELGGEVAEEGGGAVGGGGGAVGGEGDGVHVGARVDGVDEVGDGGQAVGVGGVA